MKKALSLALSLALCLGLAVPAFAAESPKITWLPEGLHPKRNPEVNIIDPVHNELLTVCTGTYDPQWGVWDDEEHGLMDKTGKLVVPVEYDWIDTYPEELFLIGKDGKTDLIDTSGRVIASMNYSVSPFRDGLAQVADYSQQSPKYGFIDKTGSVVIPLEYDSAGNFSEGLAAVCKNDQWSFIDKTGTAVVSLGAAYSWVNDISEGLAVVCDQEGKMGAVNRSGQTVIPPNYDLLYSFSDGLACAGYITGINEYDEWTYQCGFVDTTGTIVVPLEYDDAWSFAGGAGAVCRDGRWSLVDKTGKMVDISNYGEIYQRSSDGLSEVYGYESGYVINPDGSLAIPEGYDFMWQSAKYGAPGAFFDDVAAVAKNGKWGYMDRSGKILLPLEYDEVGYASGGLGVVRQGSRYGIVDLNTSAPAGVQAMPTNDSLSCDGLPQSPTVYKINGSNYFKIRDLAAILNGTGKQFSVGYDGALNSVTATTGEGYTKLAGDLTGAPAGGNKTAEISNDAIYINGIKADAEVYKIDGSNYFKLRDLGRALDFYVGWTAERGMFILTGQAYSD